MYNPKFNYHSLSRETIDGQRLYSTPDGGRVPSVTTILDRTKSEEKKQVLANWRRSVGEKRAQEITTEAANRGTRMHKYLEDYVKTGEIKESVSNPYAQQSLVMAQQVIEQGLSKVNEFWGVEIPLYFPGVYAGTTDCVGLHQGAASILDFKQSNKPKKIEWIEDYFLQLVAYAEAHNEVYGTNIHKGVVLMCVKPSETGQGQWSQPQYQEWIIDGQEFDKWKNLWWQRVEQYYLSI